MQIYDSLWQKHKSILDRLPHLNQQIKEHCNSSKDINHETQYQKIDSNFDELTAWLLSFDKTVTEFKRLESKTHLSFSDAEQNRVLSEINLFEFEQAKHHLLAKQQPLTEIIVKLHEKEAEITKVWGKVKQQNTLDAYNNFIKSYPSSSYVSEANQRIIDLTVSEKLKNNPEKLENITTTTTSEQVKKNHSKLWIIVLVLALSMIAIAISQKDDNSYDTVLPDASEEAVIEQKPKSNNVDILAEDASPAYIDTYVKMANEGNNRAMRRLGILYYHGRGVDKDRSEAYAWFSKSADAGNISAMRNKAYMLLDGDGVSKDTEAAITLMIKASESGDEAAKEWVEKNNTEVRKFKEKSSQVDYSTESSDLANKRPIKNKIKFTDFSVKNHFSGTTSSLDLSSEENRQYRTRLKNAWQSEVNFAGEYVITTWGCGSSCAYGAVVSKTTGKVTFFPHTICCWEGESENIIFRKDSRLLVLGGVLDEESEHGTHFFEFTGSAFKLLSTLPIEKE